MDPLGVSRPQLVRNHFLVSKILQDDMVQTYWSLRIRHQNEFLLYILFALDIFHTFFLVFLLLTLNKKMIGGFHPVNL